MAALPESLGTYPSAGAKGDTALSLTVRLIT